MEWAHFLPPASWVAVTCEGAWGHCLPAHEVEGALLRCAVWIPRAEVGPLRRCTKLLSQQLLPADWCTLLRLHFEQLPCPAGSALWYWAPATSLLSHDSSEGRMLSCLMDAWVSLGHFPAAREPTLLRLACQYLLALRDVTVWPSQPTLCAGAASWSALMDDGLRLPPLHCCYLGPYNFYRRVFCGSSASICTVARGALAHTRAYFARTVQLHLNSVAGELVGLVPALRRAHVALRTWLARDHPSNWCVVPDGLLKVVLSVCCVGESHNLIPQHVALT